MSYIWTLSHDLQSQQFIHVQVIFELLTQHYSLYESYLNFELWTLVFKHCSLRILSELYKPWHSNIQLFTSYIYLWTSTFLFKQWFIQVTFELWPLVIKLYAIYRNHIWSLTPSLWTHLNFEHSHLTLQIMWIIFKLWTLRPGL